MKPIPYILMKCAMSLDGHIDDSSETRLLLSNEKDFDRVDAVRASCDAILVGANTIRKDNPRLLIKSGPPHPTKVTLTSSGSLDSLASFFTTGDAEKIVYTTLPLAKALRSRLSSLATVVGIGETVALRAVLEDLYKRGIRRLLIEGGSTINTQFLQAGLVDELQISIVGFFVGQKDAPRFVKEGKFPWSADNRMHLDSVQMLDDVAVLRYVI